MRLEKMAHMKLRKLEEYLQEVNGFTGPKIALEQYKTPPHIASCIVHSIQMQYNDIDCKMVADLGCGSGILAIGANLMGAHLTIGFEIDGDALNVFRENVTDMELSTVDGVQMDVTKMDPRWTNAFDTVVMNPPFGTKNSLGIDMIFVENGIRLATSAVYSLHKTSTRQHIKRRTKEWGVRGDVVAELSYNIEACYKFHRSQSVDIEVDFWRFDVVSKEI